MKIGDVSAKVGMPASTIRYYEKEGLITPPRRVSGKREFDDETIFMLEFVRLSQAAGFTIAETKALLKSYARDQSAGGAWQKIAARKQADVRAQLQELKMVDAVLSELISCQCESITECIKIGIRRKIGKRRAKY